MTRVLHWTTRGLALLLAAVAVVALVAPRNTWFVLPAVTVWVVTAAVVLLPLAGRRARSRVAEAVARRPAAAVGRGTAVAGLVVVAHLPLALIDFGWDARQVYWGAELLAADEELAGSRVEYFAKYPNNIPLLAMLSAAAKVGSWAGLSPLAGMLVAQTVGLLVVVWCLGSTLVRLDRPGAVWPVQALATVLLGLNPQVAIPYADLPTATFVAVALWAGARAWRGGGRGWWALAAVGLVLAVSLKPYAVALALGALALVPGLAARRGRLAATVTVAGAAAALAVGVLAVHAVSARVTGLPEERLVQVQHPYPVEHFLAMGTYDSQDPSPTRVYGGWNWEHASAMKHERDQQVRREISRDKIVAQVSERGVLGNLAFVAQKVAWTWGDGTFWAHGEGQDAARPGLLPGALGQVQQWFVGSGEPYRQHTAGVLQGVWVATLLLTAAGLWRAPASPWVATCALTLVVLTAYLGVFETRPRYLVALLPVLLVLAGLTAGRACCAESGQYATRLGPERKTVGADGPAR
ncbi:hypothetical protein [Ornithinimicrobium pekingense]|uniref:Glycosyltransferase RgtA/B/C/D-like domain-containing protein n=1 Tax=Ornithinimicrobium pekingense TaxID=384677 RepID=A0ABQ2F6M3_9MICO|nr:hypothetical protein [Ornithinimicrobium pekingense]GGK66487.1 hypothetical protein GCM10011509_13500 [Ornithinimicrobium pekingense]